MLRVTINETPEELKFQLEGRLVGPWVQEAHDCWQCVLARDPRPDVHFDLAGVTMIDHAGKEFLAAAHAQGASLAATGCLMRAIIAQIANSENSDCGCR